MIILLSGDGKYDLEGEDLEHLFEEGRRLFSLLKEGKYETFSSALMNLHMFVKKTGKPVDIFRNADIIIPPTKSDPQDIKEIFGLE